eukprot:6186766-Pleurochrysis_carterae.AAC.3
MESTCRQCTLQCSSFTHPHRTGTFYCQLEPLALCHTENLNCARSMDDALAHGQSESHTSASESTLGFVQCQINP